MDFFKRFSLGQRATNRTILELKRLMATTDEQLIDTTNRTILELKQLSELEKQYSSLSHQSHHTGIETSASDFADTFENPPIAPYWN